MGHFSIHKECSSYTKKYAPITREDISLPKRDPGHLREVCLSQSKGDIPQH